jgi:two-component system LytT family response regulator
MLNVPRVLIVDDEKLARSRIRRFLKDPLPGALIEEAADGPEAVEKTKTFRPQIIFLDIQMPEMSGFDVLKHFEDRPFRIIFQTAYDEFAVQAFEECACDYLLKPFTQERFNKALGRALQGTGSLEGLDAKIRRDHLQRISVRVGQKTRIIPVSEIDCFVSKDHYTCVYSQGREWIVELSLSWLETHLDPARFLRIHRNGIASLEKIASVGPSTAPSVLLKTGMEMDLSRTQRKKLLTALRS